MASAHEIEAHEKGRRIGPRRQRGTPRSGHALGWMGAGLGAAAILAPRGIARWVGMANRPNLVRAVGAAAVAGSALDLLRGTPRADARSEVVHCIVRINRDTLQLYRFWRELENLPRFMHGVDAVGSELVADEPERRIEWRSRPEAAVLHCGSVSFEPARSGRGTFVRVELRTSWPGAAWTSRAARLLGVGPEQRLKEDLRRFKQLLETGEIATTEGQSSGRERKARA